MFIFVTGDIHRIAEYGTMVGAVSPARTLPLWSGVGRIID